MDEFINRLRSSTASLHKSLEESGVTHKLMTEQVHMEDYFRYLQVNLRMQQEMEQQVFPELKGIISEMDRRKKSEAIINDLNALKALLPFQESQPIHPFIDKHAQAGADFNLGMLYVTEGSTLGGLYILKHLKGRLGGDLPSSFLAIYGEKTGPLWRQFLQELVEYVNTREEDSKEKIISGAIYAFERAHAVFNSSAGHGV
jgi:heme oxygenase